MPLDGTTNPTTQVILDAIDYLEKYGWCQGAAMSGSKRCLWGALRRAAGNKELLVAACQRVEAANHFDQAMGGWNDEHGRTKEQVIEALHKAL